MDEISKHFHIGRDRVHVTISRKVNVAKYESVDISIGYSSDKSSNEDVNSCFNRVETITISEFEKLMKMLNDGKIKGGK